MYTIYHHLKLAQEFNIGGLVVRFHRIQEMEMCAVDAEDLQCVDMLLRHKHVHAAWKGQLAL